ncbi:MAG: hypothetical protein V1933_06985 [Candidatus Omnitrophota bacterium]
MENNNLVNDLSKLGFQLLNNSNLQDANATLAEVAKSNELRFWEGFPVVLANCAENNLFDYNKVMSYLPQNHDKANFDSLMDMSLALYKVLNLKFSWANKYYKSLNDQRKNEFNNFLFTFKNDQKFMLNNKNMSTERVKTVFNNYFNQSHSRLNDVVSVKNQFDLEYALSQMFPPKQKELFMKKLRNEKMSKTEREYYSRVVRKKVQALANSELNSLAQKLSRY